MSVKYYVDGVTGEYLGGFDGINPSKEGAVEVPRAPTDARQVWDFVAQDWGDIPGGPPRLEPLEFVKRFSTAELVAIMTDTVVGPAVAAQVLAARSFIALDDPDVVNGMQALVDAGLITAERRDVILTYP